MAAANNDQTQPRVKKKRKNWSKGENAKLLTKALTYYKLRENEIEENKKRLSEHREKRALRKQKLEAEKEKKRKEKEMWAEKVSSITPVLVAASFTKDGKASSVPQIRRYLKKVKKLKPAVLKEITKENVLEKWRELS